MEMSSRQWKSPASKHAVWSCKSNVQMSNVKHDCKMRVVTLIFLFKMTPLFRVVLLKINFEPTVCRFKHFLKRR